MPYDFEVHRFRGPYSLELSASPGSTATVHVQFKDGRRLAFDQHNDLASHLKVADQELIKLYQKIVLTLGQTYNVFAKRDIGKRSGIVFLGVTFDRGEGVRPKRWAHEATDDFGDLVEDLRESGFPLKVEDDGSFGQIMVTVASVDEAIQAFTIIDEAVRASPKNWGW